MRLQSTIVATDRLSPAERDEMFELIDASFSGAIRAKTHRDIAENDFAILLRDPESGRLGGFSLAFLTRGTVDGRAVGGICSDDTIVDRAYWGTTTFIRALLGFLLERAEAEPDRRWYWFYACKGYRTYRFMPMLFDDHYPAPDRPMPPDLVRVVRFLAGEIDHAEFDPATGLLRWTDGGVYVLRPGVGDIDATRLTRPDIAFFQRLNPAWTEGVELACIAPVHRDNLTARARRWLAEPA